MHSSILLVCILVAGFFIGRKTSPALVPGIEPPAPTAPALAQSAVIEPAPFAPEKPLPLEIAKLPVVKRLSSLFDEQNYSGTARHLLAAFAEMSAEDFRLIFSGKERFPDAISYGMRGTFGAAFAKSYVERWLAVDETTALAALPDLAKKSHGSGAFRYGALFAALVESRPREAAAAFLKMEPDDDSGPVSSAVKLAFSKLAAIDTVTPRLLLEQCQTPAQRMLAETGIALAVAATDPVSGAALAQRAKSQEVFRTAMKAAEKLGGSTMFEVVRQAESGWIQKSDFSRLALLYPDAPWESLSLTWPQENTISGYVMEAAKLLSRERRAELLERSKKFPNAIRSEVQSALLDAWATEAPETAGRWALARPPEEQEEAALSLTLMFSQWKQRQPEKAQEWWNALPPGPVREHLGKFVKLSPAVAPGDFRGRAKAGVQSPPRPSTYSDSDFAMNEWLAKDASGAAEWARSLTDQKEKDHAFAAYAKASARVDVEAAKEWATAVVDARVREVAAQEVFAVLHQQNPVAAREWLRGIEGVHPLWKQWMLRNEP